VWLIPLAKINRLRIQIEYLRLARELAFHAQQNADLFSSCRPCCLGGFPEKDVLYSRTRDYRICVKRTTRLVFDHASVPMQTDEPLLMDYDQKRHNHKGFYAQSK